MDEFFNAIIQRALAEAARVDCSAMEYREQLHSWISEIETAIQASEETDDSDE